MFFYLFIHIYLSYSLFFILKIVGSTPLTMHWYFSLVTLSSIEIITFLVQLLIWDLEENYIIEISRLVGRTQKQKENISLKKQKKQKQKQKSPKLKQTKTQKIQKTPPPKKKTQSKAKNPTKYHNIGTFPNWTGKSWKSSMIECYHTSPDPS